MKEIHKAGLLAVRDGRMLLCGKRDPCAALILPGGKLEAGETAEECLLREIREELGNVAVRGLEHVGTYVDRAANSTPVRPRNVRIELFRGELEGEPKPCAEIARLVWFGEADDQSRLAPSLVNKIIPDLIARGLLGWRRTSSEAAQVEAAVDVEHLAGGVVEETVGDGADGFRDV